MTSMMPVIHFKPTEIPTKDENKAKGLRSATVILEESESADEGGSNSATFKCPVYKTSVRAGTLSTTGQSTNFILSVDIPIERHGTQDHWSLRGTALLTMLND